MGHKIKLLMGACALCITACGQQTAPSDTQTDASIETGTAETGPVLVSTEGNFAENLQLALIEAEVGDHIQLPEGRFDLVDGLSLDVNGVRLSGAGQDKTILSFANQAGAGEGLLVTSDDVILEGFTMQDTAGDGIKSKGADRIIYRDLTVEWTGEPNEENGAYAVYPVESEHILVENVTVRGASDAGIYVGQSSNIIVRNSLAEFNVAGIEIENSTYADVYGNTVTNNAGGILIFDLPDIPVVGGHSTRVYSNRIVNNNYRNFAPPGNIVATVPSGTGLIVLATDNLHIFDNEFDDNRSAHVALTAYSFDTEDERYNPLPLNVVVRDNTYGRGGYDPQGVIGDLWDTETLGELPAIMWDGVSQYKDRDPMEVNLTILEDESVSFVNLGAGRSPIDPTAMQLSTERPTGTPPEEPAPIVLPHIQES